MYAIPTPYTYPIQRVAHRRPQYVPTSVPSYTYLGRYGIRLDLEPYATLSQDRYTPPAPFVPTAALPGADQQDSWGDMPKPLPLCLAQQQIGANGTCPSDCVPCKGPGFFAQAPQYCCQNPNPPPVSVAVPMSAMSSMSAMNAMAFQGGGAQAMQPQQQAMPATVAAAFYGPAAAAAPRAATAVVSPMATMGPTGATFSQDDGAAEKFRQQRNCPFGMPDDGQPCTTSGCMVCDKSDNPADGAHITCCDSNKPESASCKFTTRCLPGPCAFTTQFGARQCMYCPGKDPYSAYVPCVNGDTCTITNKCTTFADRVVVDERDFFEQQESSGGNYVPTVSAIAAHAVARKKENQQALQSMVAAQGMYKK